MTQRVDQALALSGDERRLRELLYHYRTQFAEGREQLFLALAMTSITLKARLEALERRQSYGTG